MILFRWRPLLSFPLGVGASAFTWAAQCSWSGNTPMTQLSSQAGSASRTTLAAASPSNVPPQSEHNNFQGVCQERDLDHGQADRIRQAIFMRTSDIRGISGHNYFSLAYTKEIIQHIPRKKRSTDPSRLLHLRHRTSLRELIRQLEEVEERVEGAA